MRALALLMMVALLSLSACGKCKRSPCEATDKPAQAALEQGIAGAIALEDNTPNRMCNPCAYAKSDLAFYQLDMAIGVDGVPDVMQHDMATHVYADGHYAHELEAGPYLVCDVSGQRCALVTVVEHRVTTLNVLKSLGEARITVFAAGKEDPEADDSSFHPDVPDAVWQKLEQDHQQ